MTKIYPTRETSHITQAMLALNMSASALRAELGLAGAGTVAKWLKDGKAPKWTTLAIEGLLAQHTAGSAAQTQAFLLQVTSKGTPNITQLSSLRSIRLDEQDFWLVKKSHVR